MGATRRRRACTCSKIIHNATFWWRGAHSGGHRRDHHCGILTIGETPETIWGPGPANETYGCWICRWIAVTRTNDDMYSSNAPRVRIGIIHILCICSMQPLQMSISVRGYPWYAWVSVKFSKIMVVYGSLLRLLSLAFRIFVFNIAWQFCKWRWVLC